MLRALRFYLAVSFALAALGGGLYGATVIGVPELYGVIVVAGVISLVGYARWDIRHYG